MRTRITGGKLKGMVLTSSKSETLRPTLQMVRSAICSIFGNNKFDNIRMLDLYSGTGALGLEALSRGAKWVDFVEKNRIRCRNIRQALLKFGFEGNGKVYCAEVENFIPNIKATYNLVTIDPPYRDNCWKTIMPLLENSGFVEDDSLIVAEHSKENQPDSNYGSLVRTSARRYGDSYISIYTMDVTNG